VKRTPVVDGRRVERFIRELKAAAPHYVPDMSLADANPGVALIQIFAHLAELVDVRIDRAPDKHFVAFLDSLGILPLPARAARAAVAFRLAADLQSPVLIPAGTRVTAPGPEDEIPFETRTPLLALPGGIAAMYAADPANDAIFRPPPRFLAQQPRAATQLQYVVQAFAAAGADRLQLDHTTDLAPGAYVRIDCREQHVIRKVDDGNIVALERPLAREVNPAAPVAPIRDFEVFNGINLQEHVLHIAHGGVLTLKERAEITVSLQLQRPSTVPLDLVWQFWTKDDTAKPEQEAHWQDLEVVSDGTVGLMVSGDIVLLNPKPLEVKPVAIDGIENRWIRAKVIGKLTGTTESLPRVESLSIAAKSKVPGDGIPPDQAFYNATPIDAQVGAEIGFLPFGPEPRQFDQFYIASEEAFSKKDATIKLHFTLDLQTLASPAAAAIPQAVGSEVRAYSIGLRRRLYQLPVSTGNWESLGDPSTRPMTGRPDGSRYLPVEDSVPAVLPGATTDQFGVFVMASDTLAQLPNSVWMFRPAAPGSPWVDLSGPVDNGGNRKPLRFSPAAVQPATPTFGRVFVVDGDGALHSRLVADLIPTLGNWQSHGGPPHVRLMSSPFVVRDPVTGGLFVYVTGVDTDDGSRAVYEFADTAQTWRQLASAPFQAFSRPFAVAAAGGIRVYVVGYVLNGQTKAWQLRECDPGAGAFVTWDSLGLPPSAGPANGFDVELAEGKPDACAPSGHVEDIQTGTTAGRHLFLRSADGRLYERLDDVNDWRPRQVPGDPRVIGSASTLVQTIGGETHLDTFVATNRNSLARIALALVQGVVPVNALRRVALLGGAVPAGNPSAYDGTDIDIVDGGSGQISTIVASDTSARLVRAANALVPLPGETAAIRILKHLHSGTAPAGSSVKLPSETAAVIGQILDIAGKRRTVLTFNTATKVATFDPPLGSLSQQTTYEVYAATHEAPGRAGAERALVLRVEDGTAGPAMRAEYLRVDGTLPPYPADLFSARTGVAVLGVAAPAIGNSRFTLARVVEGTTMEFRGLEELEVLPALSWEYWNGRGWLSLTVISDSTRSLLADGVVVFDAPDSLEKTEVVGQNNFWIRARLVGGDYGHVTFIVEKNGEVKSQANSLRPPKVRELRISYDAKPAPPEACITLNNLDYVNQTAAAQLNGAHFAPFERLEDAQLTVFVGFDQAFKSGPVQILFDAAERETDPRRPPAFAWKFRKDHAWRDIAYDDGSVALTQQGILALSSPDRLTRETLFSHSLYWVKGSFRTDRSLDVADYPRPLLRGAFLNTAWAVHGETITEEAIGSSSGDERQAFHLQHADILEKEDIRVREALSIEEQLQIERAQGAGAVVRREDLGGTWVQWRETNAFFDAGPEDRFYRIDRAAGVLHFGDGHHGRIPPAGLDNIRAFSYRTGGGEIGNLAPGAIDTLATSIDGVESAFNPTATGGGSDKADTKAMLTVGPRQISHRGRAVSPEDFEELAYEASRQVAKVRCLPATNLARLGAGRPDPCDQRQHHPARDAHGWVSLIIVPVSSDPLPCPTLELRRAVADFLRDRAPSSLVAGDRLAVRPPDYVVVDVFADVFVSSLQKASQVENQAVDRLRTFLHPLKGGPAGDGWDFGRPLSASDVFAELERIPDIDRVERLSFAVGPTVYDAAVPVGPNELLAGGTPKIRVRLG
jgi:baseplate J-like protein